MKVQLERLGHFEWNGRSRPVQTEVSLRQHIQVIFRERLNLDVPSDNADLFDTGVLDSMSFVQLLLCIEQEFGIDIKLESLDLDSFKSIERIAWFVAQVIDRGRS